jgi:hypothetical protein
MCKSIIAAAVVVVLAVVAACVAPKAHAAGNTCNYQVTNDITKKDLPIWITMSGAYITPGRCRANTRPGERRVSSVHGTSRCLFKERFASLYMRVRSTDSLGDVYCDQIAKRPRWWKRIS